MRKWVTSVLDYYVFCPVPGATLTHSKVINKLIVNAMLGKVTHEMLLQDLGQYVLLVCFETKSHVA